MPEQRAQHDKTTYVFVEFKVKHKFSKRGGCELSKQILESNIMFRSQSWIG